MLVRDPSKRYSLAMVQKHHWMQTEVPQPSSASSLATILSKKQPVDISEIAETRKHSLKTKKLNEQVLRVMQSLGIDPVRTTESVRNDSYDHHAAIYFLLQDRLASSSSSRSSSLSPNRSQQQQQQQQQQQPQPSLSPQQQQQSLRRRPSSIAEQGQARIQTENLLSLRDSTNVDPQFAVTPQQLLQQQQQYLASQQQQQQQQQMLHLNLQQQLWQSPAASKLEEACYQTSSGMLATDFNCLTCGGPILENTTSTTTCVKCARLRIRRRNFAHPVPEQGRPMQFQHHLLQQQQQQMMQQHFEMLATKSEDSDRGSHGRHDSRDSGVSSGSSQDYGECTPTAEKNLIFPRFPASSDRPSLPMSQLVRKLSEVEGISPTSHHTRVVLKTSLDEGVSVDIDDSQQQLQVQQQHQLCPQADRVPGKAASFDSASLTSSGSTGILLSGDAGIERAIRFRHHKAMVAAAAATAPTSQNTSFASTESYPYESFDESGSVSQNPDGDEEDLTQSLPSCTIANLAPPVSCSFAISDPFSSPAMQATVSSAAVHHHQQLQHQLPLQHNLYQNFQHHNPANLSVMDPLQRHLVKSPVSFREGRRASDGLMAQGPFQQRLYERMKAHGAIELHDVHEECRALQNRIGQTSSSAGNSRSGTPEAQISAAKRPSSASPSSRPSISKRISVPENFTYFPTNPSHQDSLESKQLQQFMHHRLFQKRQTFQLQKPSSGILPTTRRNLLARQAVLKYGANKLYLPSHHENFSSLVASGQGGNLLTVGPACGHSSDFLFQPIAEDEADGLGSGASTFDQGDDMPTASSNILSVPTCLSMPVSPTFTPPMSRTPVPSVILDDSDVDMQTSTNVTSSPRRHRLLMASHSSDASTCSNEDPYIWQTLPSYMAESCRLGPMSPNPPEFLSERSCLEEVMDTTARDESA